MAYYAVIELEMSRSSAALFVQCFQINKFRKSRPKTEFMIFFKHINLQLQKHQFSSFFIAFLVFAFREQTVLCNWLDRSKSNNTQLIQFEVKECEDWKKCVKEVWINEWLQNAPWSQNFEHDGDKMSHVRRVPPRLALGPSSPNGFASRIRGGRTTCFQIKPDMLKS